MDWKKQLRNPLVQQYVLEIALPLVGYLLFDWSLAVIITFYFIDYLCSEIARHRRHHKIRVHWNEPKMPFITALVVSVIIFTGLGVFTWWILDTATEKTGVLHITEIISFLKNEGWFLVPIVYFANYMKDVMTFYAPRRFTKYNFRKTIGNYYLELMIMAVLIACGLWVWSYFKVPDVPALLGFVVVKLAFDLLLVRKLKKESQKA